MNHENRSGSGFDAGRIDHVGIPDIGSTTGREDSAIDVRSTPGGISYTSSSALPCHRSARSREVAIQNTDFFDMLDWFSFLVFLFVIEELFDLRTSH